MRQPHVQVQPTGPAFLWRMGAEFVAIPDVGRSRLSLSRRPNARLRQHGRTESPRACRSIPYRQGISPRRAKDLAAWCRGLLSVERPETHWLPSLLREGSRVLERRWVGQ